jgi:hypothetical protein
MRRVLPLLVAVVACAAAVPSALSYGWPLKPFHKAHPIRGNFGDPRTVFSDPFEPDGLDGSCACSFHNGLDISGVPGQAVYPVVSGVAHVPDLAAVTVRSSGDRAFQYWHITPTVYDGQRVTAYRTVLGHIDGVASHVHFSEIDSSVVINPVGTHHLRPYSDRTKPRVESLLLRGPSGQVFKSRGVAGSVELVAQAYDMPALPVPGSWYGYPVAPAVVSWALLSGNRYVVQPTVVVDFRYTLPLPRFFWSVYARGTYQNKPRFGNQQYHEWRGRFEYRLTPGLFNTRKLADGTYTLRVTVEDTGGNRVSHSEALTVCNADPTSCTTPPPPSP